MKILLIFLLLLSGLSCSDKPSVSVINEVATIFYQKTISFDDELTVEFASIQESRCPEGVQCVRAGELLATLVFELGNAKTEATFCINGDCLINQGVISEDILYSGNEVTVSSKKYRVEITDFSPQVATQTNDLDTYSLSLRLIE